MSDKVVPESVRKLAAKMEEINKKKKEKIALNKQKMDKMKIQYMERGEKWYNQYMQEKKDIILNHRQAKAEGTIFVPPASRIILATRIRGICSLNPKVKKTLQLLRLRQIGNAVFFKVTPPIMKMLKIVEPYITYGYPSRETISKLMYKRGYMKDTHSRIPVEDNRLIEKLLGKYGIICMEDLITELYTAGPHFKEANNAVWPFKLSAPKGGFSNKRQAYQQGGQWGNREEMINPLMKKMIQQL